MAHQGQEKGGEKLVKIKLLLSVSLLYFKEGMKPSLACSHVDVTVDWVHQPDVRFKWLTLNLAAD